MAVGTWTSDSHKSHPRAKADGDALSIGSILWNLFRAAGSLKITVAMFALGMLIVFVGTLAQDEESIVDVKKHYFNSWIAMVPLDVFAPVTIWRHEKTISLAFPIPGGATIGLILLINLIAAKLTRFSMSARGARFAAGVLFSLAGAALIALVIASAHYSDGLQGEPPISYDMLWWSTKGTIWLATIAAILLPIYWRPKARLVMNVAVTVATILTGVSLFLILSNDAYRIPDPGLRILWQLTKSLFVSFILLVGMLLLFGKRGGNVLIHLGVGLMMLGQFIFGDRQIEERITMQESQTTNMSYRIDEVELAIIDTSLNESDRVAAIDQRMLQRSAKDKSIIELEKLPFNIQVAQWMTNSRFVELKNLTTNPATAGLGLQFAFQEAPKVGGVSEETNMASAYVTLVDKKSGRELGTYLVSQMLNDNQVRPRSLPESVEVDGQSYDLELRFRRTPKPYQITLTDVRRIDYSGTATPQDYSSIVSVIDAKGERKQDGRIWMNNPMRYEGETFYQSGYSPPSKLVPVETTTLQVVTNPGWLIPYVCCILVGLGMLVHFSGTFGRFASRYERQMFTSTSTESAVENALPGYTIAARKARDGFAGWAIPVGVLVVLGVFIIYKGVPPRPLKSEFDWYAAGQIPMQYGGRLKPLDSVARNVLQTLSNKPRGYDDNGKAIPAAQWLMAVMADKNWVEKSPVLRIDAKEVLDRFGLDRAPKERKHRYSFSQIAPKLQEVRSELAYLEDKPQEEWTFTEAKLSELLRRVGLFQSVLYAYRPQIPKIPDDMNSPSAIEDFRGQLSQLMEHYEMLERTNPPGVLPPNPKDDGSGKDNSQQKWQAFGPAMFAAFASRMFSIEFDNSNILAFTDVIDGIRTDDARKFNRAVEDYRRLMAKSPATEGKSAKIGFEAWYNRMSPFTTSMVFYITAGVLCLLSFLVARQPLRRTAFWICVFVLVFHTCAIISRIYISERPPVVNLYSAAVFIGWATVLACLVMEALFPVGIAILIGAAWGTLSLLVADYGLDGGDTMPVLQAVLDTQFWLSTHVITVTLGYSATFVAGGLAIGLIVHRVLSRFDSTPATQRSKDNVSIQQMLYRMTYGVVCFAIFFSFVGTVLGGLWADDSWGRFWGWDPKENGALMIVIWNALLLHARWDKMVHERGFALLAIVGNIVTAWSMFGTNQLGIGLHAYGGATLSAMLLLGFFVFSQLLIIGFGWALTRRPASLAP